MSEEKDGLEQRIGLLEEFLDDTLDIGWFRGLLKSMLFEFRWRKQLDREPAKTFYQMKEELRNIELEEVDLKSKYDRLMWKGRYHNQDGWDYLLAMAEEGKKIEGIPDDVPVVMHPEEGAWKNVSAIVIEKREKFLEEKRKKVDKNYALNLLVKLTRMRVDIYEKLVKSKDILASAWDLSQQYSSFASGTAQAQAVLEDEIKIMLDYVDRVPGLLGKLVNKYPKAKLLELVKALPETTKQQS